MTYQLSHYDEHILDLLPAYLNGRLEITNIERVRAHLARCEVCRLELSSWQAVQGTAQAVVASAPLPSLNIMNQVLAKIDAQEVQAQQRKRRSISRSAAHLWLVFKRQIPLIHKSIWIAAVGVSILMLVLIAFSGADLRHHLQNVETVLAFFSTVTAATGIAFIYQAEQDAGYEIILATPTSIRIIMICRMVLVIGFNFLLTAITSAIIAFTLGGNLWDFVQLWLGPMLLLASISLTVSVTLGSVFGVAASLIIEVLQAIFSSPERTAPVLQFLRMNIGQTTPFTLILAFILLAFAIYYAPRQPRLSNS
ncbi:MAG TPA: zf-HC2 domain-containing protein [Ktedonobacteraceae bacterium]|nr:zf-HC2 domain-containing protein [Ktedonobacteraceae bacterium]